MKSNPKKEAIRIVFPARPANRKVVGTLRHKIRVPLLATNRNGTWCLI